MERQNISHSLSHSPWLRKLLFASSPAFFFFLLCNILFTFSDSDKYINNTELLGKRAVYSIVILLIEHLYQSIMITWRARDCHFA